MNRLAGETSPYLLQHKDNPVHWFAWSDEAWEYARRENKLVIVSIGYSACHWCHVMEHEVFEDYECAELMNMHFISIKVDREERPDVDSWFMDAVHLMGSQGGWPLTVFALPDGRPIYGGTYFPKSQWIPLLENLNEVYQNNIDNTIQYAEQVDDALKKLNSPGEEKGKISDLREVHNWIANWSKYWDAERGGNRKAPKFPMPTNWELLLHYGAFTKDHRALQHARHTLTQMAHGGIYDQLGGGFSRYSVDADWKVPHFEKMLYDNAQLVSLYAQAYRFFGDTLFLHVVDHTLAFVRKEWLAPNGLVYAALDADSDGVEGKYYVWTEQEFDDVLGKDSARMKRFFGVGLHGFWEHGKSVLCIQATQEEWCRAEGMNAAQWNVMYEKCVAALLMCREQRTEPALDDKCIASWNGMLAVAYAEASRIEGRSHYLVDAENLLRAMRNELMQPSGLLAHAKTKGRTSEVVLLEDQAAYIEALLLVYELSGEDDWLSLAEQSFVCTEKYFSSNETALFRNRLQMSNDVVGSKFEINDNVIPSANGVLCRCMQKLGRYLNKPEWTLRAHQMLQEVAPSIDFAPGFSNWILAMLAEITEPVEVVFSGPNALENSRLFNQKLNPFVLSAASTKDSELPMLRGRYNLNSPIYVCRNHTCDVPVYHPHDILV